MACSGLGRKNILLYQSEQRRKLGPTDRPAPCISTTAQCWELDKLRQGGASNELPSHA